MSNHFALATPLTADVLAPLRTGDTVTLRGEIIITAGLPTHQRILATLDAGEDLPLDLNGAAFFHLAGFTDRHAGQSRIRYLNPTTSTRFNQVLPAIIRRCNLRTVAGKGGLDSECARAMAEVGCVYLAMLGGGAAIHSDKIGQVIEVGWPEMMPHYRLVKLAARDVGPLTVAIDTLGNNIYDQLKSDAQSRRPEIIRALNLARDRS